jgi:exodeoxyribonuclease VII large subunit
MILPDIDELRRDLDDISDNITYSVTNRMEMLRKALDSIEQSYHFRKPLDRIKDLKRTIETIREGMNYAVRSRIEKLTMLVNNIGSSYHFRKPADNIRNAGIRLEDLEKHFTILMLTRLKTGTAKLDSIDSLLKSFNPGNVLKRGYAIISRDSEIIQKNAQLDVGDNIKVKFSDGSSKATINEKLTDTENEKD